MPIPIIKLRLLFHFRMCSYSLPVEQGRFASPGVPIHLCRCTFCTIGALDDERPCVFDCPRFGDLGLGLADAHDAMRSLIWLNNQKAVFAFISAFCTEAQT